ncbi:hypothetical protein GCM10023231_12410 [Olivibacter ginsenosidimutans]|uniref:MvaI/BcnI restriction endonuclease domain-containing protein n=1 Tax=Olivibacter ginsenosidimutans TaxID=1176537 RepID=A0ABP9AU78_9SPHI
MRLITDVEQAKIKLLTERSVEFTLIEPTATGLQKSIMDATGPVRMYLKEKQVHDFTVQHQGPNNKILLEARLVEPFNLIKSISSLYRPQTKKGDPRIWFTGLKKYAEPHDILAILTYNGILYVVNITQLDIYQLLEGSIENPFKDLIESINRESTATAKELLDLLRNIAAMGPVPALLDADTAVGRTLETLLGININSSRNPDYKGIELKSFRDERKNRKTLFAQVPDWGISKFKNSAQILTAFGYDRGDDFKLYCTVSTIIRNSQGLKLKIDNNLGQLIENSDKDNVGDFVVWGLEMLHKRLLEKHNETFWISANSIVEDGKEYFHYKKVEHTRKPIVSQFDVLMEQGLITLDHLIKRNSKGRVSEKGPLFKIKPNALNLLFPPSALYDLC